MQNQARNKYRELSSQEKDWKIEYGRVTCKSMPKEEKERLTPSFHQSD